MNNHPTAEGQKYLLELKLAVFNCKYHNKQHGIRSLNERQREQLRVLRGKCLRGGYNREQIKKALNEQI